MRTILLACLIVAAYAEELGYNYQSVYHSEESLPLTTDPANNYQGSASNLDPSFNSHNTLPAETSEAPLLAVQPEFEKEFFTYVASEDDFSDSPASEQLENSVKQGLRVIFIKGPENNGVENAAVALTQQINDQRTAIYVLQKQTDLNTLANRLNIAQPVNNNKPEVHFVKYRTPADADNAQTAIQNQYDSLSGSSQLHKAGVAPTLNFVSDDSAAISEQDVSRPYPAASSNVDASMSSSFIAPTSAVDEPSNSYLPPSTLRLFRL